MGTCGFCHGSYPGQVDRYGQHICATVRVQAERTPDGHPQVWLLYRPEPFAPDSAEEREINLWVRRCDVFTSRQDAIAHLDNLIGKQVLWREYDPIFPELWIGESHGQRWLMAPAPVNPPGGER